MDVSQDSWISGKIHQDNWSEDLVRIEIKKKIKQEHGQKTEKNSLDIDTITFYFFSHRSE